MHFTRIFVLSAVAALVTLLVGSAGVQAGALSHKVAKACVISTPTLAKPSDTIRTKATCSNGTKSFTGILSYSYTQADYSGASCGPAVSKQAPSFVPKVKGTYYIDVTFTAKAPAWAKGKIKPATRQFKFVLGGWQRQCGTFTSTNLPTAGQLCGYSFTDPGNCGEFYTDASTNYPGMVLPPLPQLSGEPKFIDGTIYSAPLASPSGTANCTEFPQGAIFSFLGHRVQVATWQCPSKVVVAPLFTLYYYPPGATTPCWTRPSIEPRVNGLPLGAEFSHIVLPNDWQTWGGRMAVLYGAYYYPNDGMNLGGAPKTIAHQYASSWLTFGGQADACTELSGFGN